MKGSSFAVAGGHAPDATGEPEVGAVVRACVEAIVALGRPAVPLIVERYREGSVFWGAALRRITGVTTFGDGVVGNLDATRRGWLKWWEENQARFGGTGA